MSDSPSQESRLVELEMQLMHLERNYEQLHEAGLELHAEIENQRRRIEHLEELLQRLLKPVDREADEHPGVS